MTEKAQKSRIQRFFRGTSRFEALFPRNFMVFFKTGLTVLEK